MNVINVMFKPYKVLNYATSVAFIAAIASQVYLLLSKVKINIIASQNKVNKGLQGFFVSIAPLMVVVLVILLNVTVQMNLVEFLVFVIPLMVASFGYFVMDPADSSTIDSFVKIKDNHISIYFYLINIISVLFILYFCLDNLKLEFNALNSLPVLILTGILFAAFVAILIKELISVENRVDRLVNTGLVGFMSLLPFILLSCVFLFSDIQITEIFTIVSLSVSALAIIGVLLYMSYTTGFVKWMKNVPKTYTSSMYSIVFYIGCMMFMVFAYYLLAKEKSVVIQEKLEIAEQEIEIKVEVKAE